MEKIALLTDSACDLPKEIIEKYDINVVPLRIIYNDREYRDNIDISSEEVYKNLPNEIPKTSMPSPHDVEQKFNQLKIEGYTHCIAITVSSGLSGTYQMMNLVASQVSDIVIKVIDSKIISLGLGFLVMEAAKMIQNNVSFEKIIDKVEELKSKVKGYFIIDTLEYLKKGGRIDKFAAVLGTILNLKPIVTLDEEGKYHMYAKIRGRQQGIQKMLDILKEACLSYRKINVGIPYAVVIDEAKKFAEQVKKFSNINDIIISSISPALGVHGGPGLLGLVFYPAE
ncbi:DegV family protein [Caldicellulosiruptoraceae bacterium PP1]